jgi:hypothetical protein
LGAKRLNFSKEYKELLLSRRKVTTIRRRAIALPGEVVKVYSGEEFLGKAMVEKVIEKRLRELSRLDAIRDGFDSVRQLKLALRKHYGKMNEGDKVYVHFLKWLD